MLPAFAREFLVSMATYTSLGGALLVDSTRPHHNIISTLARPEAFIAINNKLLRINVESTDVICRRTRISDEEHKYLGLNPCLNLILKPRMHSILYLELFVPAGLSSTPIRNTFQTKLSFKSEGTEAYILYLKKISSVKIKPQHSFQRESNLTRQFFWISGLSIKKV